MKLLPLPSCLLAAAGIWICPLRAVTFHPCPALRPWRPFLRGENQVTDLRLLGVLSTIPFLREEPTGAVTLQCEQCQARAGFFGVDPADNSSFEHLHKGAIQVFLPLLFQFLHVCLIPSF